MNTQDTTVIVKKNHTFFRKIASRVGSDPLVDWGIILSVSSITALIFVCMSLQLFFTIRAQAALPAVNMQDVVNNKALNTVGLAAIMNLFQSKIAIADIYATTYAGPSDPAVLLHQVSATTTILKTKASAVTVPTSKIKSRVL